MLPSLRIYPTFSYAAVGSLHSTSQSFAGLVPKLDYVSYGMRTRAADGAPRIHNGLRHELPLYNSHDSKMASQSSSLIRRWHAVRESVS